MSECCVLNRYGREHKANIQTHTDTQSASETVIVELKELNYVRFSFEMPKYMAQSERLNARLHTN